MESHRIGRSRVPGKRGRVRRARSRQQRGAPVRIFVPPCTSTNGHRRVRIQSALTWETVTPRCSNIRPASTADRARTLKAVSMACASTHARTPGSGAMRHNSEMTLVPTRIIPGSSARQACGRATDRSVEPPADEQGRRLPGIARSSAGGLGPFRRAPGQDVECV